LTGAVQASTDSEDAAVTDGSDEMTVETTSLQLMESGTFVT